MKRRVGIESDQTAIIPLSTFTQLFNEGDKVGVLSIVSKPNADVSIVEEKVKSELKTKYRVSPEDTNAFGAFNLGKEFKKLTGFLDGMQLLTIIVGTLTIIAGVIAISNILLITVKERTKEIGIRRALGAKPSEVRNQILLESVVITLSSGLAGFMLGAEAVQVGTRFVVAKESNAHQNYKNMILKARDIDTTISAQHFGHAVRAIKNKLTRDFEKAEKEAFKQENPDLTVFENLGAGALANAVVRGDVENGSVMSGQIAGLISKEETVEEILKDIYYGAAEKIQQEAKRWAGVTRND